MMLFIKKWWLLENLRKEINRHSGFQSLEEISSGREVLLTIKFFIFGREDLPQYPGLAEKFLWWKWKYKPDKLKKRIKEYNDIFKVCVEEGYIEMIEVEKDAQKTKMPSTATSKAHKISGIFGLLEGILEEYNSVWVGIFLPFITFILGIIWSSDLLNFIKSIFRL